MCAKCEIIKLHGWRIINLSQKLGGGEPEGFNNQLIYPGGYLLTGPLTLPSCKANNAPD